MANLTDKQERFVKEYLVDLNATAAYKRAGYSARGNSAEVNASRLLRNAKVEVRVQEAFSERAQRVEVDQDWVLEKLVANVARSMKVEAVYNKDGDEIGEYQYQGSVANKALELVGKHLGMFRNDGAGVNVSVNVDNRPTAKPLKDWTNEELAFYESILGTGELSPDG